MIWGLGILLAILLAAMIWAIRKKDGPFEFIDLFLDQSNNRASMAKVLIAWFAILSTWVIVIKVLGIYKAEGVESLLLGVITVFVGQVTVLAAIDRWKTPTPEPPPAPTPPETEK